MQKIQTTFLFSLLSLTSLFSTSTQAVKHESVGDALQFVIPAIGLGMAIADSDTEGMKQFALHTAATVTTTYSLKLAFKQSPLGTRPNGKSYSFPSGHTSFACAGASYIGQRYGWSKGMAAMAGASYVGWSRIYANKHHTRDVLVGCAIGTLSGFLLVNPKNKIAIQPWYENKSIGISFSSTW